MPEVLIEPADGAPIPTPPEPTVLTSDPPADPMPPVEHPLFPVVEPEIPKVGFAPEPIEVTYTRRRIGSGVRATYEEGGQSTVTFDYVLLIEGSDGSKRKEPLPSITLDVDPLRLIYLMNPADNSFIGATVTYGDGFGILFAASLNEALRQIDDPSMADKPTHAPAP